MSVVRINAITVPTDRRKMFEERFANRSGEVGKSEGFEAFELLRPTDDRDQYLVYTRWRSEEDFMNWVNSDAFQQGHKQQGEGGPVGSASELWAYEIIQSEDAVAGRP